LCLQLLTFALQLWRKARQNGLLRRSASLHRSGSEVGNVNLAL
jgi:hypothetical protein